MRIEAQLSRGLEGLAAEPVLRYPNWIFLYSYTSIREAASTRSLICIALATFVRDVCAAGQHSTITKYQTNRTIYEQPMSL
ncbi:hypothetical protein BQ8794_140267 [Mesorhizobium prunaredense]|uniref:Uncharacterized protein n=1 Tax=Mesorhizobium prunaredense TaxID=1631249 RepID=A0A1R3V2J9_9HYPH|nr:hypothetical protein BQ8794_140267 [Mesorhizobium prunaredense]